MSKRASSAKAGSPTRAQATPKNRHVPLAVSHRSHSDRGRLRCLADHSSRGGLQLNPKYQNSAYSRARCNAATHQALGHRAPWATNDRLPKETFVQTVIGSARISIMARSRRSTSRPDTLAQDQPHHRRKPLATHGRSIHWVIGGPFPRTQLENDCVGRDQTRRN
jgi:hypothetical protein